VCEVDDGAYDAWLASNRARAWRGLARCERNRDSAALEQHRAAAKKALDGEIARAQRVGVTALAELMSSVDFRGVVTVDPLRCTFRRGGDRCIFVGLPRDPDARVLCNACNEEVERARAEARERAINLERRMTRRASDVP